MVSGGWSAPAQHLTSIPHPLGLVGTDVGKFNGAVEVGVSRFGGKESSKREWKKQNAGRGRVGKSAMVGIRDCETNRIAVMCVDSGNIANLQGFTHERMKPDTLAFMDGA